MVALQWKIKQVQFICKARLTRADILFLHALKHASVCVCVTNTPLYFDLTLKLLSQIFPYSKFEFKVKNDV